MMNALLFSVFFIHGFVFLPNFADNLHYKPTRSEIRKFIQDFRPESSELYDTFYNKYIARRFDNQVPYMVQFGPKDWGSSVDCDVCKLIVEGLLYVLKNGGTQDDLVKAATDFCVKEGFEDPRVCHYITREYKDEMFGVLTKRLFTPDEVCGFLLGDTCAHPYNPDQMWNVTMTSVPKPPVTPPTPPPPSSPKLRFLHLTDFHVDEMYQPGSNTRCGEPLCCRSNDGKPAPGKTGAGKWGDYRDCDLSPRLAENLFQHLSTKKDEFDFIIFTGDIPAHNVWNQSREDQIKAIEYFSHMFDLYLPNKPVYHCVGNHESSPVDSFPPPFITDHNSNEWLNSALASSWLKWLPREANETIIKGAFYTVSPYKGLRIISLNNNYCNKNNWWLMVNSTDPAGQLQWLIQVLQEAENNHEKVYILAHIPPGINRCLKAWSWNYYKIVSRYESTIVAQFYGHTHNDFYFVFYDDVNFTRPTSVGYVAGSVTPYTNLNPGYRIYTSEGVYEGSSFFPIDYENYVVDLPKANNASTPPQWQFEYSAKATYSLKSLYPTDWNELIYRMKTNDTLFQTYRKNYMKSAPTGPCSGSCKRNSLCELKTARSHDPNLCKDL